MFLGISPVGGRWNTVYVDNIFVGGPLKYNICRHYFRRWELEDYKCRHYVRWSVLEDCICRHYLRWLPVGRLCVYTIFIARCWNTIYVDITFVGGPFGIQHMYFSWKTYVLTLFSMVTRWKIIHVYIIFVVCLFENYMCNISFRW